jgi:single-stranded-DNA-specific exonuclease
MSAAYLSPGRVICARPVPQRRLDSLPDSLHPVLRRVLAARHVAADELSPVLSRLLPVSSLPGVDAAAERLQRARDDHERIVVIGDFDADGATATAVMTRCLRELGFGRVTFLVPNRFEYGYGLTPEIVDLAAAAGPGLLVTVDNGVTSVAGVARARQLGLEVLVTDHHLPGPELPGPAIIVNPNLPGSDFGSRALCGAGVAFYVMAALAKRLGDAGTVPATTARSAVADCLDLVALGTVADLVPMDFNNRVLVAEGLRRIRCGRSRPGIAALFAVAGRELASASAADLGFAIAPRLNAAGRLQDMAIGIQCLLAGSSAEASMLASQLDQLNTERRDLQARMQAEAEELLGQLELTAPAADVAGVCLFDERWHQGIVGLVASRIRERTGQPAIAFARGTEDGLLRGSARSVDGINVRDVIAMAAESMPASQVRFGGHAMAAGISLPLADLSSFQVAFSDAVRKQRGALPGPEVLWTDGQLAAGDFSLDLATSLSHAGPWGPGFPEPLFDNRLVIARQRVIGERHLRLKLRHPDGSDTLDAVAFNATPLPLAAGATLRLVFRLDVNRFRGSTGLQLVVEHVDCD